MTTPTRKRVSKDSELAVTMLQTLLLMSGYNQLIVPDGNYDEETTKGLQAFQEKAGLEQTGELDDNTLDALKTLHGVDLDAIHNAELKGGSQADEAPSAEDMLAGTGTGTQNHAGHTTEGDPVDSTADLHERVIDLSANTGGTSVGGAGNQDSNGEREGEQVQEARQDDQSTRFEESSVQDRNDPPSYDPPSVDSSPVMDSGSSSIDTSSF